MNWKKQLLDPSLWLLILVNAFSVYYYERHPQIFTTLIWLYWSQSILFGLFNFLDMLTAKNVDVGSFQFKEGVKQSEKELANASAWVFLMHYGFFHFVYFIFLITMAKSGPFDWSFYIRYFLLFFVFQLLSYIQHRIRNRNRRVKIDQMFITPYLRVIPMHLCILIPAFFHVSNLTVFLILKVIADVMMYIVTIPL